jgi:MSHA biogenesis protein MshI
MKLFTKQKKPGWVALRTSEDSTCVVHVIKPHHTKSYGNKPTVTFGGAWQTNLKNNTATKNLVADLGLARQHCSLLLAQGEYKLVHLEKPNVPANELKQALSWKLKELIDYPVEQATIDVINIPADPNNKNRQSYVYAIAAKNELLSGYIQRFIDSGASLEVIDIPELAQRNIAAFLEQENRGLAMLSISSAGGLLTFTSGGELYHARHIDIDITQLQSEDGEQKSKVFERLSLEIQRSLDSFEREFTYIATNRLVLAPFAGREDCYDYLKSYLNIQIDRLDLADVFEFEDKFELGDLAMQASLLPVLGAALREGKPA